MSKKRVAMFLVTSVGLAAALAYAEWGHGLGGELKSPYIPEAQQSGWSAPLEAEEPTVQAAAAPQAMELPPVEQKVEAVPVAPPPQQVTVIPEDHWQLNGVTFESGSDRLKPE